MDDQLFYTHKRKVTKVTVTEQTLKLEDIPFNTLHLQKKESYLYYCYIVTKERDVGQDQGQSRYDF